MSQDEAIEQRLYVGNISKSLAEQIDELQLSFSKYGEVVSPFEIKTTQTFLNEVFFGFLTIKIDQVNLKKLISSYNNVNFKNNKIIVQLSKSPQNQSLEKLWFNDQKSPDAITERDLKLQKLLKRNNIQYKRENYDNDSSQRLKDVFNLIEGRERKFSKIKIPLGNRTN